MKIALWLLMAALFFIPLQIAGCAEPAPPPPMTIKPIDTGDKTAVQAALKTDPDVASQMIEISVKNKVVTLTGTVASEELKTKAEALALKTSGVTQVINNLEVKP